jgi:hypothetical protein
MGEGTYVLTPCRSESWTGTEEKSNLVTAEGGKKSIFIMTPIEY